MIIDSSVLVAIITQEPDASRSLRVIAGAREPRVPAPTYLETALVLDRRPLDPNAFDRFLEHSGTSIEVFTPTHAHLARDALRRYGRGSGSRARLNFGDCMAYAVAKVSEEPLLFKGDDFIHTDVRNAFDEAEVQGEPDA